MRIRTCRWALLVCVLAAAAAVAAQLAQAKIQPIAWRLSVENTCPDHFEGIAFYRGHVWRYERRMGKKPTRPTYAEHVVGSCVAVGEFVIRWRKLAKTRRTQLAVWVKRHARSYSYTSIAGRPAHYAGWMCIHSKEGAWNDPGAPYYGGLQMSWNWMGVVPGGDAGKLAPMHQMWLAERVSAKYGFSYSWMSGQWPNTFPPCAGYF